MEGFHKGLAVAAFRPRFPWWGGDLQTLRNTLMRERGERLAAFPAAPRHYLLDGQDTPEAGDCALGILHLPAPRRLAVKSGSGEKPPLVVLIHGLTGSAESPHIRISAAHFLNLGVPVLRLDLRGAGKAAAFCRRQYHAGRSEDLRTILNQARGDWQGRGLFLLGYSLGGNMLLKFLAESGGAFPVRGAATVSAPLDLKAACKKISSFRNMIYHNYLLKRMKRETASLKGLEEVWRTQAAVAPDIYRFDDLYVAPANGFAGAEAYYAACSARGYLAAIRSPTLLIHAGNDPWVSGAGYPEESGLFNQWLYFLRPKGGGHVGFHGRGTVPFHDRLIGEWLTGETGKRPGLG